MFTASPIRVLPKDKPVMIVSPVAGKTVIAVVLMIIISATPLAAAAGNNNSFGVVVKDGKTGEPLDGAVLYLDGDFKGTTPAQGAGALQLYDIKPGTHTLRSTRTDYRDSIVKFESPSEKNVDVTMMKGSLFSLNKNGPSAGGINVIFIPSATTFSCSDRKKISDTTYITNQSRFKDDVVRVINRTYLNLDRITSPSVRLPDNYQNSFNFYYYYNPAEPADAFSGCAGTVPDAYWDEVTFGDITVILYPTYYGRYTNSSCQPAGCYKSQGPGRRLMKVPSDKELLFVHETGHAVFGLVDTYCGNTYYYQNSPYPNVWTSPDSCTADAQADNRDPAGCRQIEQQSPGSCFRQFWHYDPDPDIMANVNSGTFGAVATQRIRYILTDAIGGKP